jgi:hypothetical protein
LEHAHTTFVTGGAHKLLYSPGTDLGPQWLKFKHSYIIIHIVYRKHRELRKEQGSPYTPYEVVHGIAAACLLKLAGGAWP